MSFDTKKPTFAIRDIDIDKFDLYKVIRNKKEEFVIRYDGHSVYAIKIENAMASIRGAWVPKGEQIKDDQKKKISMTFGYEDNEELALIIDAIDAKLLALFQAQGMSERDIGNLYFIGRPKDDDVKNKFMINLNERVKIKLQKSGGIMTKVDFDYDQLLDEPHQLRGQKVYVTAMVSVSFFNVSSSMRGLNLKATRCTLYPMVDESDDSSGETVARDSAMDEDDDDERPARKRQRVGSSEEDE